MKRRSSRHNRFLGVLVLLLGLGAASPIFAGSGTQDSARPLWVSLVDGEPVLLEEPEWRGRRVVLIEPDFLAHGTRGRFQLELFEGEQLEVELVRREVPRPGSAVWYGEVGEPGSGDHLMLAVTHGAAAGTLRHEGRLLRLRGPAGALTLSELDAGEFPACGTDHNHAVAVAPGEVAPLEPRDDQPPGSFVSHEVMVDVLTVWTPQARVGAGGLSAIQATVDLAMAETALSLENCDADMVVRLVHAVETPYVESGSMNTDLSRLRSKTDGHMDEVHDLRDAYGADVVALITNTGGFCGLAYLMTNVSPSFESWAFGVTRRSCATGNYTFGHELGHNFGSAHDPDNAGNASHAFSYGYRTPNASHRTVMAYSPGTRVPIFSSPLHTWAGQAMGVHNANDNARSLTLNAPTIAAWRSTMVGFEDYENYCVSAPNSVGEGAQISAEGTTSVATNAFVLWAAGATPHNFGLFYYGPAQVQAAFGDGVRCVGAGGIGTFRLGSAKPSDFIGEQSHHLDFDAPPASSGPGAISPGSTWNFQFWYRDPAGPGGTGFNLSNGLSATFYP